jgi:hypothetical protein
MTGESEHWQPLVGFAPIGTDTTVAEVCMRIERALNGLGYTVEGTLPNPERNVWLIDFNDKSCAYTIEIARTTDRL